MSQRDHDFPGLNCPPIPWKEAVPNVPLGTTAAPGPPSVTTSQQRKFGKKRVTAAVSPAPATGVKRTNSVDRSNQNGGEFGDWDPMTDDHRSRDFNSYQTGAGALMQAARDMGGGVVGTKGGDGGGRGGIGGTGDINLFISNIPTEITKASFREMFGRAGKVSKANVIRPKPPTKPTTYGFVEYRTMKEATNAIQMFNNFDMGGGVRLQVKVSETKENREKRLGKKREEEEFLSTLHCGKYSGSGGRGGGVEGESNGYEMTEEEASHPNPFLPSYKPRIPVPGSPQEPGGGGESKVEEMRAVGFSLSGSGGAPSIQATKGRYSPPVSSECKGRDKRVAVQSPFSSTGSRVPQLSPTGIVIRDKTHSEEEGEGFDIPTPPIEEVIDVLGGNISSARVRPSSHPAEGRERGGGGGRTPELTLPIIPAQSPDLPPSSTFITDLPLSSPSKALYIGIKPISLTKLLEISNSPNTPLPSVPLGSQPPKRFNGVITSTLSCSRFSVVIMSVEVMQAFNSIAQCDINSLALADPLCLVPGSKVGFIDERGQLYRMEVNRMMPQNIDLCFYDFGGALRVSSNESCLYMLPRDVVTIPCLRYRCCLNNVECKDFVGNTHLINVAGERLVQVTVNAMRRQHTNAVYYDCDVQLSDGSNLSQLMAIYVKSHNMTSISSENSAHPPSHLLAPPPNHSSLPKSSPIKSASSSSSSPKKWSGYKLMYMAKDSEREPIPSAQSDFLIVPQVVDSPRSIWGHIVGPQLASLNQLQLDLKREYDREESEGELYSPRVGELCVVKHCQDHQYYRAEVLCINNNGTTDVRFVDYGQREMVLASQIKHIIPAFLSLPFQGIHFSLVGVAPSGHALNWGDDAIAYIRNKILNKKVVAELVSSKKNVHSVRLSDPNCPGKSIADEMVSNGWCVQSSTGGRETPISRMAGVRTVLLDNPKSPSDSPPSSSLPLSITPQSPPGTPPSSDHSDQLLPVTDSSHKLPPRTEIDEADGGERGTVLPPSSAEVKLTHTSIPVGSEEEVVVCTASGPTMFHVQRLDHSAQKKLSEITQQLNSSKLIPLPPSQVTKSCYCVARYYEDNLFYRSKIFKASSSKCTVRFIDYGNLEDVPSSELYILPESCTSLSAQALQCSLQHFKSTGPDKTQPSNECNESFKALVQNVNVVIAVKMVMDSNPALAPKHIVEVRSLSGRDLLGVLAEKGYAIPDRSYSPKKNGGDGRQGGGSGGRGGGGGGGRRGQGERKIESPKSPPKRPWGARSKEECTDVTSQSQGLTESPLLEPDSSIQPPSQTPRLPTARKATVPQSTPTLPLATAVSEAPLASVVPLSPPTSTTPQSTVYPHISNLEKMEMPSETEYVEVVVTSIDELPNFYVQLATLQSLQMVSKMETELNSSDLPPPVSQTPAVGQVVICQYHVDKVWYRASVKEVKEGGKQLVVHFIDYGNQETVSTANVVPCPEKFLKAPVLSLKCALNGIYPPPPSHQWLPEAISFLQKYCEHALRAKISSRNAMSGVLSVDLFDSSSDSGDISIAQEMIRLGLASPSPPKLDSPPLTPPTPSSSWDPPSSNSTLTVPDPTLPQETEFEAVVLSVSSLAEFYLHPVTPETSYYFSTFMSSISEYCVRQTQAPTTPPLVGHYCLALFDGNWYRAKVESYDSAQHTLSVFFVDYGNREVVQLSQIRSIPAQFCDVPGLVVKCALSGIGQEEFLKPDHSLCSQFGELVTSSKMKCSIDCGHPLTVELMNLNSGRPIREELSSCGKLSPLPSDAIFSMETRQLEEGETQVIVSEFHGPEDFWLQSYSDLRQLIPVMKTIQMYCNENSSSPDGEVVFGQLCCAKFSEDNVWYRARVIGFPSPTHYQVFFVDYGNSEICNVGDVCPATGDHLQLPALAVRCSIAGWKEGDEYQRPGGPGDVLQAVVKGWKNGKVEVQLIQGEGQGVKM